MSKIGVFDSGIGGMSVVHAINAEVPEHEILFVNDTNNVPYGDKNPDQLLTLVVPLLLSLQDQGCDVIVIACNTVTTTIISNLRSRLKVPLIGMEPMVKPAAQLTQTGFIAVCATPATLQSKRYKWLKQGHAPGVQVIEPDCSDWAFMIETNTIDRDKLATRIVEACDKGADIIVLGCTHYHWIEDLIKEIVADRAKVLQPEVPVLRQIKKVIATLD